MEVEHQPTLTDAHQQIRLGDGQSVAQKWASAIVFYQRAIEFFEIIQKSLDEQHLKSIVAAQIEQCRKTIHLCQLKDRAEQIAKAQQAERSSRITRAHSVSSFKDSSKLQRPLTRHNTFRLDNAHNVAPFVLPTKAKKHEKHVAEKLEELQMSNEALKLHLKAVYDRAQQLEKENDRLRNQNGLNAIADHHNDDENDDDDDDETELEATL